MRNQPFRVSIIPAAAIALVWLSVSAQLAGQEGGGGAARTAPIAGCPPLTRDFYPCAKAKAQAFNPPRNPDGTPDMNGAWNAGTASGSQNIEDYPGDTFFNPARTLIVDPPNGKVPYLPKWATKKQDNWQRYIDPIGSCHLTGVPRQVYAPRGQMFLQSPGVFAIVSEFAHLYRSFPTDNSAHLRDSVRLYMGDSRGHWEGNTLVVDTTNLTDRTWLSISGEFHSDALHVTERFTLVDADTILYETTLVDPKAYTQPWTMAFPLMRMEKGHEVWEEACLEGDRDLQHLIDAGHKIWFGLEASK